MNKAIVTLATIVLVLMVGCAAMMNAVTPAYIEPEIIADTNEPATSFMPFTSLWDAERIFNKFDYLYQINQRVLMRRIEDNDTRHAFLRGLQLTHIEGSKQFQEAVFSPTGAIGVAFPGLVGLLIGWRGLTKPGDKPAKKKNSG